MRSRGAIVFVVLVMTASACGANGGKHQAAQGPTATNADGSPAVQGGGGGPDGGSGGNGGGSQGTKPGGGTGDASTTSSTAKGSAPKPTSTTKPSGTADTGAHGGVGAYARTLLRAKGVSRIVIEPMVQQGAAPTQSNLDRLLQVWRDESKKDVTMASTVSLSAGNGATSDSEIRAMADANTRNQQSANQAVVHYLFLKGHYDPDDAVLGVAVRGDTVAEFRDTVKATATPVVTAAVIEDAVVTHETGHLLGLVDIVLHTGRADPQHPGHSTNKESVMYWAVDTNLVNQVIAGPPPNTFDSADRADLATIRNGG